MKKSRAGFCMLGHFKDRSADDGTDRFDEFRPAVAFGTQTALPLDVLYVCYRKSELPLFEIVRDDILEMRLHGSRLPRIAVKGLLVDFENPWSFDECFKKLGKTLSGLRSTEEGELLVCLNSGTHTMQFVLYLLMEKNIIQNTSLIQLRPGSSRLVARTRNTVGAEAMHIDWEWTKAGSVIAEFEHEREQSKKVLEPLQSRNQRTIELLSEVVRVGAFTSEPLMLLGETGTGKTILARKIHQEWARRQPSANSQRPLREMNCAHFTGDAAYAWLFGYRKGSFTGAEKDTAGLLKSADGGTLFLDEVSELDQRAQAMLLKALEEGLFYPLGESAEPTSSRFRLICATNVTASARQEGTRIIRRDLLARIGQWRFTMPSLRDRREDIEGNVIYELDRWNTEAISTGARSAVTFQEAARSSYCTYAISDYAQWPGNFRDLISSIRRMATRASLVSDGGPGTIDGRIVDKEIAQLENMLDVLVEPISERELFDGIAAFRDRQHPTLSICSAAEKLCLDSALRKTGTKADAARLVIERPGTRLSNPSARYNQRYSSLES